ncbi:MAG: flagellar biosynthesis protein FlhF [Bdellovibrionaceae bacterium]|nr:flagellar biosynthesis protein FlhF [Bdellovibrio sp.]
MQVKKFEARSMKEALEMIKSQLGPDAIILSAKEMTKGFGLGGEKSIEVTAAYSEAVLHKKKFVESKFAAKEKDKFQKIPAKNQKEVMQKMIEGHVAKMNAQFVKLNPMPQAAQAIPHKNTERRYIDIDNDHNVSASAPVVSEVPSVTQVAQKVWNDMEVNSLKQEIETLKQVMTQFRSVPQSFVQAHPGADLGIHYSMSATYQRLVQRGLLPEIAADIIVQAQKQIPVQQQHNKNVVDGWMAKYILDSTPVVDGAYEQFHLFVGPSGGGKTSSLIKLASDLILNHRKRVAIITTDTSKVGASEQMKIFAQILNVPYLCLRSQQDWAHVIPHLDQLDHILVDYAGLNLRNQEELNYLKRMSPPAYKSLRTHLVLSTLSKDGDLIECAKRYQNFRFNDVIFSGLDEASMHGNIYNFIRKIPTRLFAFGIGTKVPEDFEKATPERVADLILQITQNNSAPSVTQSQNQLQIPASAPIAAAHQSHSYSQSDTHYSNPQEAPL